MDTTIFLFTRIYVNTMGRFITYNKVNVPSAMTLLSHRNMFSAERRENGSGYDGG
jgi:hypothetical protein